MKSLDLYNSFLKTAKISSYEISEDLGDQGLFVKRVDEFTITNKQGFFIKSLMNKNPASKCDPSVIFQDNSTRVVLVDPPHFIKFNGFFTIRKSTLTPNN